MGKGGVAVAAQRKRNESHTVAEPAMSGSLKRVRPKPKRVRLRRGESSNLGRHPRGDDNSRARALRSMRDAGASWRAMRVMDRPARRDRDERVPRTLAARPTLGRSLERERAHAPNFIRCLSRSLTPLPPSSL